jgi:hypothetical protein
MVDTPVALADSLTGHKIPSEIVVTFLAIGDCQLAFHDYL